MGIRDYFVNLQMMIKLAIIEDTQSIREVAQGYFEQQGEFEVPIAAMNAEDFFGKNNWGDLDMVLCDIGLPGKSGTEAAWIIKEAYPKIQVVMFTVFEDKDKIFQSLQAGASGYLLKKTPLPEIKKGLLEVMKGGATMSPDIAKQVIAYFRLSRPGGDKPGQNGLTAREATVIAQAQKGYSNRAIAEKLCVSIDTIKYHIRNIYEKLQINSRDELLEYYRNPFEK